MGGDFGVIQCSVVCDWGSDLNLVWRGLSTSASKSTRW